MTLRTALIINGDSADAQKALGDLENAMERAEAEARQMGRSAGAAASEMAREAQRAAAGIGRVGGASRIAGPHLSNLGFQVNDVVQGFAMGQPPMQIFMQQGFQIGQIASQAGVGVGTLAKEVALMTGRFLLAHPVLAAIAVAAGAVAFGFKILQDQVNDDANLQQFVQTLGLTKKELKELDDVTVTTGDMFNGLWKTIADRTGVDESIRDFKSYVIEQFIAAAEGAGHAIAGIYGEVVGTYRAITIIWDDLPAMFQATFARAVNAAAEKLEKFINDVIGSINSLARQANQLLGMDLFGQIGSVSLGRVEADFSKSFGNIRGIIRGEIASATKEAQAAIDGFIADVKKNAAQAARDRLSAQAQGIIDDRGEQGGGSGAGKSRALDEQARAYQRALDAARGYAGQLAEETQKLGLNAIQLKEREATLAATAAAEAAANAPTAAAAQALRDQAVAILQNFEAWKARTAQLAQEEHDKTIARLRAENDMIGLVGAARERAALALEEEAFKASAAAKGIADVNAAWREYMKVRLEGIDRQELWDKEKAAVDALASSYQQLGQMAFGALSDIIFRGGDAADVMRNLALSIAEAVLQAALLGQGPLAGLFGGGTSAGGSSGLGGLLGSLFGGPRAEGGPVSPGKFYTVNERSTAPGLFIPLGPGRIEPASNDNGSSSQSDERLLGQVRRMLQSMPPSVNVNFYGPVSNAEQVRRSAAQAGAALSRAVAAGQRGV